MNLLKRHPYITFVLCAVLYLSPFMRVLLLPGDEGTLLYDAVRVAHGQIPYRDFFEVMGPGTFYWVALFFKLFGTTWFATRVALMITSVTTALVMFFLARRLRSGWDTLPAIFLIAVLFGYIWPAVSHHGDSNLFALLSFAAFIVWLDKRRPVLLLATGALAACTTCFLQPKGLFLFAAFLLLVGALCRREARFMSYIAWLVVGYSAVAACVFLFFWIAGGLSDFVYANFVWPLTRYNNVNSVPYGLGIVEFYWKTWAHPLAGALSPPVGYTIASTLLIPFLIVAILPVSLLILAFFQRSQAFSRDLLPYWVAGWALWFSEIHRKDITHLIYGSPLLIILFFCLLGRFGRMPGSGLRRIIAVSAFALIAFNGCLALAPSIKVQTARGSVYMFKEDPILTYLNTHVRPGDNLLVYSYSPMYYFLTGANNPTKYSIFMYEMNTEAQFLDAARSLQANDVRYVVWDNVADSEKIRTVFFPKYAPPPKQNRILEQYLTEHYDAVYSANSIQILERHDDAVAKLAAAQKQ